LPEALLEQAVVSVLESEGIDDGEVSLTFLPDDPIRVLNLRWRGHDWVPDVIAFGLHDPGETPVGDIYIALEQAARQAEEHRVPDREELVRLVIHGTLHVLGYDHPEAWKDRLESELYRKQEEIVQRVLEGPGRPSGTEIVD
jgi:probable rRNA maturation factor